MISSSWVKAELKQASKRSRLAVMGKKRRSEAILPKLLLIINQILPIIASPLCTGVNKLASLEATLV